MYTRQQPIIHEQGASMAAFAIENHPKRGWGSYGGDYPNLQPLSLQQGPLLNVELYKG